MANYPVSLDTITNPTSGNTLDNPSHSLQHSDANDILEALEQKVGIGSSVAGSATSGHALVASTGGTTSWTTIGTAGISSGTATSGQVLTANGSGGVSFGNGGLTLINTTSFSAVASQSINDVFSATYDNYRIHITATFTADVAIRLRFRVSGADNTTANYYDQYLYQENTTLAAGRDNAQTSHKLNANTASSYVKNEIIVFDPFSSSTETNMFVKNMNRRNAQNSNTMTTFFAANTSFTGFTFFPDSGNMTGSIQVYGFNK